MMSPNDWDPRGIPTTYKGIRFRSRAEARWGVTFDSLGWRWDYEPVDMAGYVPDFVLHMRKPVAAEVKGDALSLDDLRPHAEKILRSDWKGEFLLLGARLFPGDIIGLIGDDSDTCFKGDVSLDNAVAFRCLSCGAQSVRSESLSWRCRLCDARDGNAHVGHAEGLAELWAAAGNRVQWTPGG